MHEMDIDNPNYSRWSYCTSGKRSENHQTSGAFQTCTSQQASRPPPLTTPRPAVQTSPGVWEDDDDVNYSSEWPPVQEYLDTVREDRRMVPPPSEIVFTLAALHVVHTPSDVAHWIFWSHEGYYRTAERVSAIALHTPRLIKTSIPWIGSREYKWIVNAIQEKYYYVHICKKWYPTDYQPLESKKRTLRSTGTAEERPDMTVNEFFNIVDDGFPPTKRLRKSTRKVTEPKSSMLEKRFQPSSAQQKNLATSPSVLSDDFPGAETAVDESPVTTITTSRSNSRAKRKVSPSMRTPTRVLSTPNTTSPIHNALQLSPSSSSPSGPLPSSPHSRNRSISQSSVDTLVEEGVDPVRSPSVESAGTAIGSWSSKKRKAEVLDQQPDENNAHGIPSNSSEKMTTRGCSSKKVRAVERVSDSEKSQASSRTSTPEIEPRTKSTRLKTKPRKARV